MKLPHQVKETRIDDITSGGVVTRHKTHTHTYTLAKWGLLKLKNSPPKPVQESDCNAVFAMPGSVVQLKLMYSLDTEKKNLKNAHVGCSAS